MLRWERKEDGSYHAENGAASFTIEKVENKWFLEASRHAGGMVFQGRARLRDAKYGAEEIACRDGWHTEEQ